MKPGDKLSSGKVIRKTYIYIEEKSAPGMGIKTG
jgi:hypothetical protein|nr:MAG TPA: hypothetical protein [Caudoviricetes sp.]